MDDPVMVRRHHELGNGWHGWDRTSDDAVNSGGLYHLSYMPIVGAPGLDLHGPSLAYKASASLSMLRGRKRSGKLYRGYPILTAPILLSPGSKGELLGRGWGLEPAAATFGRRATRPACGPA